RSLGPFGGDGKVVTGTLTTNDIVCDTSLARNLNNLGYFVNGVQTAATKNGVNGADLLVDSPPTVGPTSYDLKTPNPWTNGWDFKDTYFVTIKKGKLDSLGFDIATWHVEPDLVGLHNSPAKDCPTPGSASVIPATGGDAILADGVVSGAFTTLTGPSYTESFPGEVTTGTIILNAPAGFVFDTGGTAPTVASIKIGGGSASLIQGSVTSRTSTQITYTVTGISGTETRLTWQNIRVRPTSGTPLARGYLTRSGTAAMPSAAAGTSFGELTEIAGAASALAMLQQPSATATAGVAFDQQPSVAILDQFGNLRSVANGVVDSPTSTEERSVVTAVRLAGSGALQGSTSVAAADGVVVFTNLSHNVATTITIQFTLTGVTPVTSDPIAISVGPLSRLGFATQPG
ncbi:MAG TPA: hypothetical protein VNM37_25380, partial [Candidatus Dormibacteraeota bacterium]|nr:hypothetical protein [Candidatus Dormibacteraeota bacterium]